MIDETKILTYGQLVNIYKEYCKNIDTNVINLGFPTLHKAFRNFRKQELLSVLAKSGVGKSILTLNFIMNYLECSDEAALVLSLEMSNFSIAERIMQLKLKMEGELIERGFVNEDEVLIKSATETNTHFQNLRVVAERIEVHDIPEYVASTAKMVGKPVGLVLCDHIGLLRNMYHPKDPYGRTTDNMVCLYNYAKDLNTAIINVSQVSREEGKKDELGLYSAKESGEVENSSDFIITFEQVPPTTQKSNELGMLGMIAKSPRPSLYRLMRISIRKNRRGSKSEDTIYALMNTRTIIISEFNSGLLTPEPF